MAPARLSSALACILLLLTAARCANRSGTDGVPRGSPPEDGERQARARGLSAPKTVLRSRGEAKDLDLARLAESVGEATEVGPEALARLEARGGQAQDNLRERRAAEQTGEEVHHAEAPPPSADREKAPQDPAVPTPLPDRVPEPKPAPAKLDAAKNKEDAPSGGGELEGKLGKLLEAGPRGEAEPYSLDEGTAAQDKKQGPTQLLPKVERRAVVGQVLVTTASGRMEPLPARAVRVVAYVQGPRARTVVDYVFENPHDARLEGTFYYHLPADGSPAGFAMFDAAHRLQDGRLFQSSQLLPDLPKGLVGLDELTEAAPGRGARLDWGARKDAKVVSQARAREVYEEIVRQNIDPALMEWSGGGNFQARVFPLEPRALKRIVVAYEQPLLFDGARFRYHYELPAEPSLIQRTATVFADTAQGQVGPPAGAVTSAQGRWARYDLEQPRAPIEVSVAPAGRHAALRGKDLSGLGGEAFYAELRPELVAKQTVATRRALLLVDTSLSAEEGQAHQRRARLLEALLAQDPSIEEYAVLLFDVRARWLHAAAWRRNDEAHRRETLDELRAVYLEGATNFAGVLEELEAQRSWALAGQPTAFLLSDGEITWGLDKEEALAARYPALRGLRWVSYQFGEESTNRALFDFLAAETAGRTIQVLSADEIPAAAQAHRAAPFVLESVQVQGAEASDLVVAGAPRLVFPGQVLRVGGRLPAGGAAKLRVEIRSGDTKLPVELALPTGREDSFAPRAWAELFVSRLVAWDDERLDRMVVALSQHYRLANARASFLILDNAAQEERYQIRDEKLDLSKLEDTRRREEDQRRDKLLGLGLDEVSQDGRQVLALLRRVGDGLPAALAPQPLLDAPYVGGEDRFTQELEYRRSRAAEKRNDLLYDRIARARALSGDTAGALRALSCTVELRPRDAETIRWVSYALLGLGQYDAAVELLERLRLLRPFEGNSYLEEALALDALGRVDLAARNLEILLARSWARHDGELKLVAARQYSRLLSWVLEQAKLGGEERALLERRRAELTQRSEQASASDLEMVTLWSTDSVDIDLWIYEPNGEKCYYGHRETGLGGKLFWDVTDGLGPELYQAVRATRGQYDSLVHFFGSRAPRLAAPTAMLLVVDRQPLAHGGARSRRFQMRTLPARDAVLMLRTDQF